MLVAEAGLPVELAGLAGCGLGVLFSAAVAGFFTAGEVGALEVVAWDVESLLEFWAGFLATEGLPDDDGVLAGTRGVAITSTEIGGRTSVSGAGFAAAVVAMSGTGGAAEAAVGAEGCATRGTVGAETVVTGFAAGWGTRAIG